MNIAIPSWSTTELEVMRVGLGFVVISTGARFHVFRPSSELRYPVGIARILNLQWAASRRAVRWMQLGVYAAALFYVANLLVPVALVCMTVIVIVEVTFRSSDGGVNHGDHLLAIVLTAQTAGVALWLAAEHWSWDLGGMLGPSEEATAAWWAVQVILAVYFTSGLIRTRGRWIERSPGLLLSNAAHTETDRLMGEASWGASGRSTALVAWLLERPTLTRWFFAGGLLVELAAPIGLLGKTALLVVGLALLALHAANGRLLGLPFPQYQILVLVYLVNVPQFVH
jgi:hypothetical protein